MKPIPRRSWVIWLVGLAAVTVLATAGMLWYRYTVPSSKGPVTLGGGGQWEAGPEKVGRTFAWGSNFVGNHGDRPARLTRVELIPDPGRRLSVVGARSFEVDERATSVFGPWPDKVEGHVISNATTDPLKGFVLKPGTDARVIVVMRLHKEGETYWEKVRLHYEVDDGPYVTEADNGVLLCTKTKTLKDGSCDLDGRMARLDDEDG